MLFNEEQLKTIEEMAALFFSPEEIAINLEIDEIDDFITMIEIKSGEGFRAYTRGRLRSEYELRSAIRQAAINGSSPAQNMMITFFKDSIT